MKFLCCLCLLISAVANAELYEWVDENGQRHFSDRKPMDVVSFQSHEEAVSDLMSVYGSAIKPKKFNKKKKTKRKGKQRSAKKYKEKAKQEERCESYLKRMDKVQEKLRRGYSEPQGNKLRSRRRELSLRYQKECT